MAKRKTAIQRREAREQFEGLALCVVVVVAFAALVALTGGLQL